MLSEDASVEDEARRLKIVFLSHTAASSVFRVGSHHLSREMARMGADVCHVSTPVSLLHAILRRDQDTRARLRTAFSRRRPDADGVTHVVPLVLFPLPRMGESARRIALWLASGWLKNSLRKRWSHPDIVFVDQPLLEPMASVLHPSRLIYRPTDAHYDSASRSAELHLIARSDAVIAMSPRVLEEVLSGVKSVPRTTHFENGVDFERFSASVNVPPNEDMVYLGALDKRLDWELIAQIAARFPRSRVRILGPENASVPLSLPDNVDLLGAVPYEQVPAALAGVSIGLLPFSDDPGNQGRSPMKYYEYLAAGLYVVARASPTLRARDAPGVWLYEDSNEALESVSIALDSARSGRNVGGRAVASEHSWKMIARNVLRFTL